MSYRLEVETVEPDSSTSHLVFTSPSSLHEIINNLTNEIIAGGVTHWRLVQVHPGFEVVLAVMDTE